MYVLYPKEVFLCKYKGNVFHKRKHRVTAKGCSQKQGINYLESETYTPTADLDSRLIGLNFGVHHGYNIKLKDVVSAFNNTDLHKLNEGEVLPRSQRIFMQPPKSWIEFLNIPPGYVMELHKCIEGLKQSGHLFFKDLSEWLISAGYGQSKVDMCVFLYYNKQTGKLTLLIIIHVDDIIYTGTDFEMDRFEKLLSLKFNTTEAEDINGATLLSIQVTYDKELEKLTIGQEVPGNVWYDQLQPCKNTIHRPRPGQGQQRSAG